MWMHTTTRHSSIISIEASDGRFYGDSRAAERAVRGDGRVGAVAVVLACGCRYPCVRSLSIAIRTTLVITSICLTGRCSLTGSGSDFP